MQEIIQSFLFFTKTNFVNGKLLRTVVPNRGGIPPQGGISCVQGRNFHFIIKVPVHCKC